MCFLAGGDSHTVLHLDRHPIVAHDLATVAHPAGLALHHEVPKRLAGVSDQRSPFSQTRLRILRLVLVKLREGQKRALETTAETPERRRLLLNNLAVQGGGGGACFKRDFGSAVMSMTSDLYSLIVCTTSDVGRWLTVGSFWS